MQTTSANPEQKKPRGQSSGMPDDAAVQAALKKLQVQAWREGESELQFMLAHLMLELTTSREHPGRWSLNSRSMDIDQLDRALRREDETIAKLLENEALIWNKLGIRVKWLNAVEIQPEPFRYADLIFICFSVPHWIKQTERRAYLGNAVTVLRKFRKDNPGAMIIAVTDQQGFRLTKDPLFLQWHDIGRETSGIGKKGIMTRMVAQQLTSQATLLLYMRGKHTTHRLLAESLRLQLQRHVDGLQALQTDFNLLVVIHPGLFETHSKRIWNQLISQHFRSVEVRQQADVRPEHLRQFDFFILAQCGFPEKFRQLPEFQRISRRIYRFDGKLPEKLPQPRIREFGLKNPLETRYLRMIEEIREQQNDKRFQFLESQYQAQWKLIQEKNTNIQQINQLDLKLASHIEGYYSLIETVLMEATQQVHQGSRFAGVMKNLTRYLIVDDVSPGMVDYLVKRRFTRHNVHYMSSLDMFHRFHRFKEKHPQLKAATSYQQFMRHDPIFSKYEVVVINAWNFETDGGLIVKLRLAPPPDDTSTEIDLKDVKLSGRNLNELLSTDRNQLFKMLAAGNSRASEPGQEVVEMLEKLLSKEELTSIGRMMGVKKGRLYNLFQLEEEMRKLSDSLKSQHTHTVSQDDTTADTNESKKKKPDEEGIDTEEDSNWYMPIVRHQVNILHVIAMGCSIRWQGLMENKKAANYLEEEIKRTGESRSEILQRVLVHAISRDKTLPEKGVLAAFPDMGGSRFVYGRVLPGRSEMMEPEFALYLIDMRHFKLEEVHKFLRQRNRSPIAHVPVLLLVPKEIKIEPEMDAILGRLIGVRPGETNGFPMPYRVESLANTEQIKHLIQGILNIDDSEVQEAASSESEFIEGQGF